MSEELTGDIGGGDTAPEVSPAPNPTSPEMDGAAPTGSPTDAGVQPASKLSGSLPTERHQAILAKERAIRQKVEQELGWARQVKREEVEGLTQWNRWYQQDPEAALDFLRKAAERDGRLRRPAPTSADRLEPELRTEDGRRVYTAEQVERLVTERVEAALQQSVQPLQQEFAQTRALTAAQSEAAEALAEARTWDHFTDHEAAIAAAMKADGRLSLEGAYRKVVWPKLRQLERESLIKEMKQKATASTVSPGGSTSGPSKPYRTFKDGLKAEFAKASGGRP